MINGTPLCAQQVSEQTLSAWRDNLLSYQESITLRDHISDCAACQGTLARYAAIAQLVRQQPTPDSTVRVWQAVQAYRASHQKGGTLMPSVVLSRRVFSIMASCILAIVLVSVVWQSGVLGRHTTSATTSNQIPTWQSAWGTKNASTFSWTLPNGAVFFAMDIAPDASALVGFSKVSPVAGAEIDLMAVPSGHVTALLQLPTQVTPTMVMTDGTTVVWAGNTNAETQVAGAIDLQTQQTTNLSATVATALDPPYLSPLETWPMDHGMIFARNGATRTLSLINIAQKQVTKIASFAEVISEHWPYLLYEQFNETYTTGKVILYTIPSDTRQPLTFIPTTPIRQAAPVIACVSGDAIFWTTASGAIAQYDIADQTQHTIAVQSDPSSSDFLRPLQANARLIVWTNQTPGALGIYAWDRQQQREVQLEGTPYLRPILHGDGLFFVHIDDKRQGHIVVIDTSTLPG